MFYCQQFLEDPQKFKFKVELKAYNLLRLTFKTLLDGMKVSVCHDEVDDTIIQFCIKRQLLANWTCAVFSWSVTQNFKVKAVVHKNCNTRVN